MAVNAKKYEGVEIKGGRLYFGGHDTVKLAREFGTPLYVISEDVLRQRCRAYRESLEKRLDKVKVMLASKALLTLAVVKIAASEGLGIDVASVGEMYGALKAGVKPSDMMFHGNFKKDEDLEFALKKGIGHIVLDSMDEAVALNKIAGRLKKKPVVMVRVTPGVEAHVHEMVQVGKLDTKFGVPIEGGAASEFIAAVAKMKNLDFSGIHYHIGSQILDVEPFRVSIRKAVAFMAGLKKDHDVEVREINVGGGYPVRYTSDQPLPKPEKFAAAICSTLKKETKDAGIMLPALYMEPGRSIAGPAGITLYTVGPVKEISGVRTYVSVDGGLSDNPRPALYDSVYEAVIADRPVSKKGMGTYRVSGRHCETDNLIMDIDLPDPKPGDTMAVFTTGAYNYTMSANYNKYPRPAMVLVGKRGAEIIVKREKYADLYRQDVIPPKL